MSNLKILSQDDLLSIHETTLRILHEIGVSMSEVTGIDILTSAGARYANGRIFIPPEMVSAAINNCPKSVTLFGQSKNGMKLGGGELCWHNLGGARDIFDPVSRSKKPAGIKDVQDATRILDRLKSVTSITPFFTPQDVPGHLMSLAMYRYTKPFTNKPVQGPGVQNVIEIGYILKMAELFGDVSEILTLSVSPISPLRFPDDAVRSIIRIAEEEVPFGSLPCPTAGSTAPITLAGAISQQNAEILASIVLAQLIKPGLPIIYCGRLAMLEPRTGLSVWGGVELGLASAATVQVGHMYGLPVNVYGFSTNSHHFDIQNGFERAFNALLPALAGADELSGIGEMEAGVTGSFAQMVLDDEIALGIHRVLQGVTVNDETLAFDVVQSVINQTGNFLIEPHTSRYLRKGELSITKFAERGSWESWIQDGYKDMSNRAEELVNQILCDHNSCHLDKIHETELDQLMRSADRELSG